MNNHQVATPEMMLEDARSYIMFFREQKGKISSYIGLHLLLTDRRLFYAHSSNPFSAHEMDAVEEEALGFAEGLGALLDELDLSKLSSEEKSKWFDAQDIFNPKADTERTSDFQRGDAAKPETLSIREDQWPSQAEVSGKDVASQTQEAAHTDFVPPAQPGQVTTQAPLPAAASAMPQSQHRPTKSSSQQQPVQSAAPVSQTQPARHDQVASDSQHAHVPTNLELSVDQSSSQPRQIDRSSEDQQQTTHRLAQKPLVSSPTARREKQDNRSAGPNSIISDAPKDMKEIVERGTSRGMLKVPRRSSEKEPKSATGVVSRDREALARLLASF